MGKENVYELYKTVVPMKDHRLFMDMESGSSIIVDLSVKLDTMKYKDLADDVFFSARGRTAIMFWGDGHVRVTAKELLDVVLLGDCTGKFDKDI